MDMSLRAALAGLNGLPGATGAQGPAGSGIGGVGEDVTPFDFMDATDQADVIARTELYDHRAAIQSALDAGNGAVRLNTGTFTQGGKLNVQSNTTLYGSGKKTILKGRAAPSGVPYNLSLVNGSDVVAYNMTIDNTNWFGSQDTGILCFYAENSSNFRLEHCYGRGPGSLSVAINFCHHYQVLDNEFDMVSPDGGRHGTDGLIDQWWGCHDFEIRNNRIRSNTFGHYGIIVTATLTNGTSPSAMYNFDITDNIVTGTKYAGIWAMGRTGGASNFSVSGNRIFDTSMGSGLQVSDSYNFTVSENTVKNSYYHGIKAHRDGSYNCQHGIISNNVIIDPASVSYSDAAGIALSDSSIMVVSGNTIRGTSYTYPIRLASTVSNSKVFGNAYQTGSLGGVLNSGTGNSVVE